MQSLRMVRFILLLAFSAAIVACGSPAAEYQMPPTEVGALDVQSQALPLALEYAAQLRGAREVEVRARVSGILLERRYEEGSAVKAGELLFRIDPAPFRAQAARARAELRLQQATLQQATRERDRVLPLFEKRAVSATDRDAAIAAFETASAAVAAAEAALRTAELDLSYTEVRAPIGGVTSREARSEGSLVMAGTDSSLLTQIVQTDRLYIDFAMPEQESQSLRASLHGTDSDPAHVQLADTQGNVLSAAARIEFIAPQVDHDTGMVSVRATLDNGDGRLMPGQVVRARVVGVRMASSIAIPKRAVMRGPQGTFVWVVGRDDKVEPRPVRLGESSNNIVVVAQGLKSGERVVVDGVLKVQPGAQVKASPVELDGAPPSGLAAEPPSGSSRAGA